MWAVTGDSSAAENRLALFKISSETIPRFAWLHDDEFSENDTGNTKAQMTTIPEIIPVLQTAIGPAILISGTGLLLLTMTNRLGRAIDRARILAHDLPAKPEVIRAKNEAQLCILWRRAKLIRLAITLAGGSALLAVALIVGLFLSALLRLNSAPVIGVLFILCVVSLGGSLWIFIRDINQSLAALRLELDGAGL